jgi:hypothetical protein
MAEYLTIVHDVADYDAWRPYFDADKPNREAAGLTDLMVVRNADAPNTIGMIFAAKDPEAAMAIAGSPDLAETMQKAGVIGQPSIKRREGEFTPQASETYLTINCTMESMDKFRRAFAMDADERADAGLTDLGVMQEKGQPNDLFLLWSVDDRGRADAFMSSPELARHQVENAGITSAPQLRYWTAP